MKIKNIIFIFFIISYSLNIFLIILKRQSYALLSAKIVTKIKFVPNVEIIEKHLLFVNVKMAFTKIKSVFNVSHVLTVVNYAQM
jgi:hypothetical protein